MVETDNKADDWSNLSGRFMERLLLQNIFIIEGKYPTGLTRMFSTLNRPYTTNDAIVF